MKKNKLDDFKMFCLYYIKYHTIIFAIIDLGFGILLMYYSSFRTLGIILEFFKFAIRIMTFVVLSNYIRCLKEDFGRR